jgi:hypothetical protein
MKDEEKWEGWAIVNLMGHHQKSGYLSEQVIAGQVFIRLDIKWTAIDRTTTEFYAPGAIHSIIPCNEETAQMAFNPEQPGLGMYTARHLLGAYDRMKEELRKADGLRQQQPMITEEIKEQDEGLNF